MSSPFDFDRPPDRYAVMGNPVAHSRSPLIHRLFAAQTGQRMVYTAIQVDEGGFAQAVGNFQGAGGRGLNVTLPFKRDAWALVEERSARAERAGAVNTITFAAAGRRLGDNTDGAGLVRDLVANLGCSIAGRRVLVLGAGGAVRGVAGPLVAERPRELVIANRTVARAVDLAEEFAGGGVPVAGCGFAELAGGGFDLVINGTSAGLHGEPLALPASAVAAGGWCYDMVYGPAAASFLDWAARHGAAHVSDGLGMLVEQAAESFLIWRGVRPDTAPVLAALRGGGPEAG